MTFSQSASHLRFLLASLAAALTAGVFLFDSAPLSAAPDTDKGRVMPVYNPLPAAGSGPASAPVILPVTGAWRFRLTRGQTIDGVYVSTPALSRIISASSTTGGDGYWNGPAANAFDDDIGTHWTPANGAALPQWICVDLQRPQTVTGVNIVWDKDGLMQQYRVEGSSDGSSWTPLSDQTSPSAPYAGGGQITFGQPQSVRYVRLLITGALQSSPAAKGSVPGKAVATQPQVAEFRVMTLSNGHPSLWLPDETDDGFQKAGADAHWDTVKVPSNWETAGYSRPTYNDYDDAAGEYVKSVHVPASFSGKRIFWRFDGVFDGADIYVNGIKAGYHESGYTAFDVDVTGLVQPGKPNTLAVRACKRTTSIDCDTGDFEAMGGIYRDTFLYAVPDTHFSDLTVRTDLDSRHVNATLHLALSVAGPGSAGDTVDVALHDAQGARVGQSTAGRVQAGAADITLPVTRPHLWSAETPTLYTAVVTLHGPGAMLLETVQQKFGFRQITISPNQVLLWNGVPIKMAGTCRHEIWPTRGAALNDTIWRRDIALMKSANINAIRTSHYNHASRFLDLCDESGFYILDEVPYCWLNEKTYDIGYRPAMIQRARETFARDKNRPSVAAWSCGNENPPGSNTSAVALFMHRHDPTRPAYSSQQRPPFPGQSFVDTHYPKPMDMDYLIHGAGKTAPVIFTEQPHVFSAADNLAYDPDLDEFWGVPMERSWNIVLSAPNIIGSFVWEWQNQPIVSTWSDSAPDNRGKPSIWFENNKGVVTGYRVPKPEWWAVKMVYSPVHIAARTLTPDSADIADVTVQNRYSFTDLNQTKCAWVAFRDTKPVASGVLPVACAPGGSATLRMHVPQGATRVRFAFTHSHAAPGIDAGSLIYAATLQVAGAPLPSAPAGITSGAPLSVTGDGGALIVSNAHMTVRFRQSDGALSDWTIDGRPVLASGPQMYLGEAHKVIDQFGVSTAAFIGAGLKLHYGTPTLDAAPGSAGVRIVVTRPVLNAAQNRLGAATITYDITPDAQIHVKWQITDWAAADARAWEIGMTVGISPTLTRLSWLRDAQFADYPAGALGEPQGSCSADDIRYRASKRGLLWMTLADSTGHGIALLSDGSPLIGRAAPQNGAPTTLFASREEAVYAELSSPWVTDSDITLSKGSIQSGGFILKAL